MLYLKLLIVISLTVTNGLFAMSELAVVSSRENRLEYPANQGRRTARPVLCFIDDPCRFLSTVQIGRALIGTITGYMPESGENDGPQIVQRYDRSRLADRAFPTDEVETVTSIDMGENMEMLAGFRLVHHGKHT